MKPALVTYWRHAHRLASVQAATVLALLSLLQADVLPHLRAALEPRTWAWVSFGFALAIVLLRLLAQPGVVPPQGDPRAPQSSEPNE